MAEQRHESSSSLQRKKPPWLKLDIPSAQHSLDESHAVVQPVKGGFLRSLSVPAENTHPSSPICDPRDFRDPRRSALQRQPSITQTIKSSKKVRFERINTVPIKGQRAARHVPSRRQSLSKIVLRYCEGWLTRPDPHHLTDSGDKWSEEEEPPSNRASSALAADTRRSSLRTSSVAPKFCMPSCISVHLTHAL